MATAEAGLVLGTGEPVDLWGALNLVAELAALPLAAVLLGRAAQHRAVAAGEEGGPAAA